MENHTGKRSVLIVAGEASGEEHAMSFVPRLKSLHPELEFFGVGGDRLKAENLELIYHLRDFSAMGFTEVIPKIAFYLKARKRLLEMAVERDAVFAILIDFQTFNLSLARKLHTKGIKVFYYVAPQAWAWKAWRAQVMARCTAALYAILPFEKEWFQNRGVRNVVSVAHPLIGELAKQKASNPSNFQISVSERKEILLLPGSRRGELSHHVPVFLELIPKLRRFYPELQISIVKMKSLQSRLYLGIESLVDRVYWDTELWSAQSKARFSIASSGTVCLQNAIMGVPTVAVYRVDMFNEFIFKSFIQYSGFMTLPNLISGEELFPELKQEEVHTSLILSRIKQIERNREQILNSLHSLSGSLKGESLDVARHIAENGLGDNCDSPN